MTRAASGWRRLRSGGFAAFTCQSVGLSLIFLTQIAVARVLGAGSYGVFAYVSAWVGALGIAARCGLDTAVLRDTGIYAARNDWTGFHGIVGAASRWTLASGGTLALGCVLVAGAAVSSRELAVTFWVGAALLPISAFSSIRQSALLSLNRPWSALAPEYIVRPLLLALTVLAAGLLVQEAVGAPLAMGASVAAASITCLLGQGLLLRALPAGDSLPLSTAHARALRSSALTLLLSSGSSQLLYQIDTIMVGLIVSPTTAGKYYAAKQIALVAALGLIALQTTSAPLIASLHANREASALQSVLSNLARRGLLFAALYALILLIAGRIVLRLFGAEFEAAYPYMMLLLLGQVVGAAGGAAGQLAAMTGSQTVAGVTYLAATLLYVAAGSWAIPRFGPLGAASTAVCTTLVTMIVLNLVLWRRIGQWPAILGPRALRRGTT